MKKKIGIKKESSIKHDLGYAKQNEISSGEEIIERETTPKPTKQYGKSIRGYEWIVNEPDHKTIVNFAQKLNISEILARVIVNRGINDINEANQYLAPKLKDILPDPFLLKDMEEAVNRTLLALEKKEKIMIFADYDVDGATSSALLKRFFQMIGLNVEVYFASRSSDKYGITFKAVEEIKALGTELLISVDCGSTSVEQLKYAKELGLESIVLDHHIIEGEMPDICALVNPKRIDDTSDFKHMAAVGVTFMFTVALRSSLRKRGEFEQVKEPDLMSLLDLVALGTVCDVMPLIGINRAFVKSGLHFISARKNPGINAILTSVKREGEITASHLGYIVGPRINAGGRTNHCSLGHELLVTDDPSEAEEISKRIEMLNNERRSLEVAIMEKAIKTIEEKDLHLNNTIMVSGQDWHIGVIGIIASRLKDRYHKPSIVMSISSDGLIKGSGRSINGVDMGSIFCQSRKLGYLLEGGGHAMAGGFALKEENLEKWSKHIKIEINKSLAESKSILVNAKRLNIDATLRVSGVNKGLLDALEMAAPFGHKNDAPRFMLLESRIAKVNVSRSGSVAAFVVDAKDKSQKKHHALRCIAFKGRSSELGNFLLQNEGKVVNIVGCMQASAKIADKIDFIIDDIGVVEND